MTKVLASERLASHAFVPLCAPPSPALLLAHLRPPTKNPFMFDDAAVFFAVSLLAAVESGAFNIHRMLWRSEMESLLALAPPTPVLFFLLVSVRPNRMVRLRVRIPFSVYRVDRDFVGTGSGIQAIAPIFLQLSVFKCKARGICGGIREIICCRKSRSK